MNFSAPKPPKIPPPPPAPPEFAAASVLQAARFSRLIQRRGGLASTIKNYGGGMGLQRAGVPNPSTSNLRLFAGG